jgi:hypothetical protein
LTHKACQKHIDENYYHYKEGMDTKDYAQVAWRNPEFENLIRILIEEFAD